MSKSIAYRYTLQIADNSLILGHRLTELCGHCADTEIDLAISNIALDLLGQSRMLFQYAASLSGSTEDEIAMLRSEGEYVNCLLVEQQNEDFSQVIVRQYLFDTYYTLFLKALSQSSSSDELRAFANKTIKENAYHVRFSRAWLMRLGDGTQESHDKTQASLDFLKPYIQELFIPSQVDTAAIADGVGVDMSKYVDQFHTTLQADFAEATLSWEAPKYHVSGGKDGRHSEHMGFILSELQYMQRAYPNSEW